MVWLLLGTGIFYSLRLGLPQVRHFGHMFSVIFKGRKSAEGGITPFQALCTGLAAQVGTGNLAGVATAIVSGGPGAIFWMWITALVGMATIFGEATLAQVFRVKSSDGTYRGGPAYYLEKGLGQRWMGVLFAFSIIVAMAFIFNAVQCNSIAAGLRGAFQLNELYVAITVIILTALVIFGGLRRIAQVAEVIVPLMAGLYILGSLYVVLTHISEIPAVFSLIFKSAFGPKQVAGGVLGHTVAMAFRYGVARGLFSNEAGMGSTPNAHATADVRHPARQGFTAMMGVFVDTILICTATAAIILLSGTVDSGKTGVELTQLAVDATLGSWGPTFIAIALMFFAWTSILGNYYYGESNLMYIFPNCGKSGLTVYRLMVLGMLLFGATSSVPFVWELADFFNAIMALLNLVGILLLSGVVIKFMKDYENQIKAGIDDPVIDKEKFSSYYNR
ncbi:alanine:cation symporter family protein [Dethiosulfovibrio sp. F2B]|uniref:alanine/glycine:cation symporter family protein n=1 Tax=Dethiosulfovibrio faecalis TaxID=2720018 RepID=UPI001F481BB9|nr:alanine/glycine:cation symporter family protein [Dethiosulfovibrio faecalis]MCF4152166.1 alanine:cation symporter family protein [Dethiosulfovibrio faecalis]